MKMNKLENDVLNHQRRVFSRVFETNPSEWSMIASLWTGDLFPTVYDTFDSFDDTFDDPFAKTLLLRPGLTGFGCFAFVLFVGTPVHQALCFRIQLQVDFRGEKRHWRMLK